MAEDIRGKHVPGARLLVKALERWTQVNAEIAGAWHGESVPWWDNERALLSILSGAIWRVGGVVYEEYSTQRRAARARGEPAPGRQDLFFELGDSAFVARGRACWSSATGTGRDPSIRLHTLLQEAGRAVAASPAQGQQRLALLFARPYVQRTHQDLIDLCIETWLRRVQAIDYAGCAWVFPASTRTYGDKRFIYPGVALFVREVP